MAALRRRRGERGVTLLEVTITASLLLVVTGSVLSLLDGFTRAEAGLERRTDTATEQRRALGEFGRDLRATTDLEEPATSAQLARRLTVVAAGPDDPTRVTWTIDDAGDLVRTEEGPTGVRSRTVLSGLDPDGSGFRYTDDAGRDLVPGVDGAATITRCAARVGLTVQPQDDGATALGTDVAPRNRPGGTGC